jgi:hypothetical protein
VVALAAPASPLGSLLEEHLLDSDLRELNSMGEDEVGCLNRVAVVVASAKAVVDIRAVEVLRHSILVVSIIRAGTRAVEVLRHSILVVVSISHASTRVVEVHAPEEEKGCRNHTMAGIGDVVLDRLLLLVHQDQLYRVFLQVHLDQFPSCTKPHMSNIKPRWHHHCRRELAHPPSL